MPGRPAPRKRYAQARRVRRFELERPTVWAVISEGTTWTAVNARRMPGLVLIIACLLLMVVLFNDPRFFVYSAEVLGNQHLPAERIYEATGVDMHSVFFIAPGVVRQRLLEHLPGLQEARVSLDLPARLRIQVVERQVRFAWEVDGQRYLADDRGTVLSSGEMPPEALLIRASEVSAPVAGQALDLAVLDTVVRLNQILGAQPEFEYSPRLGIGWRTEQGWPVYVGVGGDLAEKVAVMRSMSAELAQKGIQPQFLDVGVPSRPYYR